MPRRLNRSAEKSALLCSLLAAALVCGCSHQYSALRISRKADFSPIMRHQGLAPGDGVADKIPAARGRGTVQKVQVIRYLASAFSGRPSSRMNDKGVQYALDGRFREAELLFRESLKDDPSFAPACNNLGVVLEIFGRREESFAMYSRACLIEPDNDVFRGNFLNLSDSAVK